jgi:hypothetical protein
MNMTMRKGCTFLFFFQLMTVSLLITRCDADFGDYVDPTFSCPAMTTCRQVCVASVADCPDPMRCDETANMTLCLDGSCAEVCDENLETPCPYECAPVACHKAIDTMDNCKELYSGFYQDESNCSTMETDDDSSGPTQKITIVEPAFIFPYSWICFVTFLIVCWCAFKYVLAENC